ncbi:HigA family addiction module antitoxin [Cronobacter malonaticus]|uniref:HigA family addiction module antitoxin n=1 Tax=Cronobacter malonaticus TaxID=413503 RepID=UPI0013764A86|nr:HigA family addiction module antitoxin [Cronobacter malonaticus]ELY4817336.1 HigA family addiction module antidote protein [Cronobacter malonaticus]EMA8636779.1 HigA family addiction module antidote protein [Cronobacter malonaticus]EMA8640034.1 HigA family addiction module antidote protein [Cronobacter malonaticus]MDI6458277.1 HigA family addiction module antitoxin [Cronobacter malonaticus]NCH83020.1 addiction module antidote protein, HigA family [Cronobacter malonaticus]
MATMFNPPHPGRLVQESMEALGLSARALAKALDVAPSTVQRLLVGKSDVSPEMALRLAAVLGSSPHVWLGMQNEYDLFHARQSVDFSHLQRLQRA